MRRQDLLRGFLIVVLIIFIAININVINDFLSFNTDKTIEFGHSETEVVQAWNTTEELNMTEMAKNPNAISNGYIVIDYWDDWPEDHITSVSEAKFKDMENGSYKVLKNDNETYNGVAVSKQYFSNPSKNSSETWNHIGVNYVFPKEDTNYLIQVHYFTDLDYNNTKFMNEIDERIGEDVNNVHNKDFNEFVSLVKHGFGELT